MWKTLAKTMAKAEQQMTTPPAEPLTADQMPPICGDFNIRIDRDGRWYYMGSPIGRLALCKLFSTVLNRKEDGSYWLTTPVENGRIEVEDVPFVIIGMEDVETDDGPAIKLRSNLDHEFLLDGAHPLRVEIDPDTDEPTPYVVVTKGLEGRVNRAIFYELVDRAEEHEGQGGPELGLTSAGTYFPLGAAS